MNPALRERLRALYERMDRAYEALARAYGLSCEGCPQNCCSQRFYHYTLLEQYYLGQGLREAPAELREEILGKAQMVLSLYEQEALGAAPQRPLCPANFQGRCVLYEHRPMICRLHGVPYRLKMPDGSLREGPGCSRLGARTDQGRLDRTPFYQEMAALEALLRAELRYQGRFRRTTAQMLLEVAEWPG